MRGTTEERFWAKVEKMKRCWIWRAGRHRFGHGYFWNGDRVVYAHRHSYEMVNGPVPDGLELDHLCRRPSCVNPDHLEAVTHKVNMLRGKSPTARKARRKMCESGRHRMSGDNLVVAKKTGYRRCRKCLREWAENWKKQKEGK